MKWSNYGLTRRLLLLCCGAATLVGCAEDIDPFEPDGHAVVRQAIQNGTYAPELVNLSEGQKLAIGWLHAVDTPGDDFCSATLITPNYVLTAAHCTFGWSAEKLGFGLGQEPSWPVALLRVERIIDHPDVDLSLLELTEPATLKAPQVVPLPVNTTVLLPWEEGTAVEAAGYGRTENPNEKGRRFAVLELESINTYELVVNGNGERGLCYGDSGGPLMRNNADGEAVVIGVESAGESTCLGRDFVIRLDMFSRWLGPYYGALPMPDPDELGEIECQNLQYMGQCEGSTLVRCAVGGVTRESCGARGLTCGYIDAATGYGCTDVPQPTLAPGCEGGDDFCDAHSRINCVTGQYVRYDCGTMEMSCGMGLQGDALCTELELPDDWSSPFGPAGDDVPDPEPEPEAKPWSAPNGGCGMRPQPVPKPAPLVVVLGVLGVWAVRRR